MRHGSFNVVKLLILVRILVLILMLLLWRVGMFLLRRVGMFLLRREFLGCEERKSVMDLG